MVKPTMSNTSGMPNFTGMGAMTDTLEFVKNLWGGMGIPSGMTMPGMNLPGMVVPTLSVEDIRKNISDLKAVETWLEINMNMLRGTIQALEVQAATIATLQSMGDALSATVSSGAGLDRNAQGSAAASSAPAQRRKKSAAAAEPSSKDEADAASLTAPLVNATAWWNLLQEQFRQAVNTAMTAESSASAEGANGADKDGKPQAEPTPPPRRRKPTK